MEDSKQIKAEKLQAIVEKFINDNEIGCGECIYQSDRVIENAYEFIEELCEVSGYFKYPNDE